MQRHLAGRGETCDGRETAYVSEYVAGKRACSVLDGIVTPDSEKQVTENCMPQRYVWSL